MLNEKKAVALENYKAAKIAYMSDTSKENWTKFCEAKRVCMLLGVRI